MVLGKQSRSLVIGFGSPNGDDQAGWKLIELVRPSLPAGARALALAAPTQLWDHLLACDKLIVIDSSCSDRPPGTVLRLTWPDDSVRLRSTCSTHGFDVAAALTLADALGRLPAEVVVFAVEAASCEAREDLSPAVARALPDLRDQVVHEAEMASRSGP